MPSLEAKNVQFGPCIVKLAGVQIFQAKDGVAVVLKKGQIEQKDDAGGVTVVDRYGTGISGASIELEPVNISKTALAAAMNKAATADSTAKFGVTINAEDSIGQSEYELSGLIEIFKVKNGTVQSVPVVRAGHAYAHLELNMTIGAEKQGQMKVTYNCYPAQTSGTDIAIGDIIRFNEIVAYGQV